MPYSLVRSSTRPLREYPLTHAGSSAMHVSASSIAAEKASSSVWHAARLLYAALQGRATVQHIIVREGKIVKMSSCGNDGVRLHHLGKACPTLASLGLSLMDSVYCSTASR